MDYKIGDEFWDTEKVIESVNSEGEVYYTDMTLRYIRIENIKNGVYLIRSFHAGGQRGVYWDEPMTKDNILTLEELESRYKLKEVPEKEVENNYG